MIDDDTEGRLYIVFSKKEANRFRVRLQTWDQVEDYVTKEPNVYKIVSVDVCDIPLTGIRERSKTTFHHSV